MTRPSPDSDFYRVAQVAALLNISEREVARLRDRGELRCVFMGAKVLIPRAEYEALRDRYLTQAGLVPVRTLSQRGRPRKAATAPREGAG